MRASAQHQEALALARDLGDRAISALPLGYLAETAWRQGDGARAAALF